MFLGDDKSNANMFKMLAALHLLLTKVLCLQSGGPKGTPLQRPPHEAQGSREVRMVAGFDLLKQCGVSENSPDVPKKRDNSTVSTNSERKKGYLESKRLIS